MNRSPDSTHLSRRSANVVVDTGRRSKIGHSTQEPDGLVLDASFGDAENQAPDRRDAQEGHGATVTVAYSDDFPQRALCNRDLQSDIADADVEAHQIATHWDNWRDTRLRAISIAYPIYLFLEHNSAAYDVLTSHSYYDAARSGRKRPPSRKKPWLLALEFVMRPLDENQRKDVSDWSHLLRYALHKKIAPRDFLEDTADVSFSKAKAVVRSLRPTSRNQPAEPENIASNSTTAVVMRDPTEATAKPVVTLALITDGRASVDVKIAIDISTSEAFVNYFLDVSENKLLFEILVDLAAIAETHKSGSL